MLSRKISGNHASANLLQVAIRNNYLSKFRAVDTSNYNNLSGLQLVAPKKQNKAFYIHSRLFHSHLGRLNQHSGAEPQLLSERISTEDVSAQQKRDDYEKSIVEEWRAENGEILVSGPVEEAFDRLVRFVEDLERSEYRQVAYYMRRCLYKELQTLLERVIEKHEVPLNLEREILSAGPVEVLQFYSQHKLALNPHFTRVIMHLIKMHKLQEAMQIFADHNVYVGQMPFLAATNKYSQDPTFGVKKAALLAYLIYISEHQIAPRMDYIQKVFKLNSYPDAKGTVARLEELNITDKTVQDRVVQNIYTIYRLNLDLDNPAVLDRIRAYSLAYDIGPLHRDLLKWRSAAADQGRRLPEAVYTEAMNVYAKRNAAATSFFLWNEMVKKGIVPGIESWNALLFAISRKGPIKERSQQIDLLFAKLMAQKHLLPNPNTYATLIRCYSNVGNFDKAQQIYTDVVEHKYSNIPLTNKIRSEYLSALSKKNADKSFNELLKSIKQDEFVPSISLLNNFLSVFVKLEKFDKVQNVLGIVEQLGIKTDVATYTVIIDMVFKQARKRGDVVSDKVLADLLAEMKDNNIEMNLVTYCSMIDGLMKDGVNIQAGRDLFNYLKNTGLVMNNTAYSSMISGEFDANNPTQACQLFDEYSQVHSKTAAKNVQMFNIMIRGYARLGDSAKAYEYFARILEATHPNKYSFAFILRSCAETNNQEIAEKVLESLEASRLPQYGRLLPQLIITLHQKGVSVPETVLKTAQAQNSQKK